MDFITYQKAANKTAVYPNRGDNLYYPVLGLCGEAGEVAEKIKKIMRDKDGIIDVETQDMLLKELGDVLWYINAVCYELGISISDVANENIKKLKARQKKGTIHGEGDNR